VRWVYWLPFLAMCAHVAEELPRFPAWATRHFGTTTTEWFVISHIPLVAIAAYISVAAARTGAGAAIWWLFVFQAALFCNAVFHVAATIVLREYSPGVVTALLVYSPLTLFLLPILGNSLGRRRAIWAGVVGACLSVGLVSSLWLDVPAGR
jgi:hypothetical protein